MSKEVIVLIKVLSIGAHNDEIMADMGGTAHLLHQAGCDQVFLNLACQWNDDNLSEEEKADYIRQEKRSAEILGGKFVTLGNRSDLLFLESKQIIDETARYIIDYDPDIIFIHWPRDNHIEHRETAQVSYKALAVASVRGAKFKEVYAYDTGINQSMDYFAPDFYIKVNESLDAVKESLMQYDQNFAPGARLVANYELKHYYRGRPLGQDVIAEAFKFIKFPNGSDDILLKKLLGDHFCWRGNGRYPAFAEYFF